MWLVHQDLSPVSYRFESRYILALGSRSGNLWILESDVLSLPYRKHKVYLPCSSTIPWGFDFLSELCCFLFSSSSFGEAKMFCLPLWGPCDLLNETPEYQKCLKWAYRAGTFPFYRSLLIVHYPRWWESWYLQCPRGLSKQGETLDLANSVCRGKTTRKLS